MALWKPFRGTSAALADVPKTDGHAYFCTDDGSLFFDYKDENNELHRKQITAKELTSVNLLSEPVLFTQIVPTGNEPFQQVYDFALDLENGKTYKVVANVDGVEVSNSGSYIVVAENAGLLITEGSEVTFDLTEDVAFMCVNNATLAEDGSETLPYDGKCVLGIQIYDDNTHTVTISSITEVQPEFATKKSVEELTERVHIVESQLSGNILSEAIVVEASNTEMEGAPAYMGAIDSVGLEDGKKYQIIYEYNGSTITEDVIATTEVANSFFGVNGSIILSPVDESVENRQFAFIINNDTPVILADKLYADSSSNTIVYDVSKFSIMAMTMGGTLQVPFRINSIIKVAEDYATKKSVEELDIRVVALEKSVNGVGNLLPHEVIVNHTGSSDTLVNCDFALDLEDGKTYKIGANVDGVDVETQAVFGAYVENIGVLLPTAEVGGDWPELTENVGALILTGCYLEDGAEEPTLDAAKCLFGVQDWDNAAHTVVYKSITEVRPEYAIKESVEELDIRVVALEKSVNSVNLLSESVTWTTTEVLEFTFDRSLGLEAEKTYLLEGVYGSNSTPFSVSTSAIDYGALVAADFPDTTDPDILAVIEAAQGVIELEYVKVVTDETAFADSNGGSGYVTVSAVDNGYESGDVWAYRDNTHIISFGWGSAGADVFPVILNSITEVQPKYAIKSDLESLSTQVQGMYTNDQIDRALSGKQPAGNYSEQGHTHTINEPAAGKHSHTVTSSIAADKVVTAINPSTTKLSVSTGNDTFVKSYPGTTSKLNTTSITGVSGSTSASTVSGGTTKDIAKAGTAVVYGKANVGTAVTVATRAASQTTVGNANVGAAVNVVTGLGGTAYSAEYDPTNECLTLSALTVATTDINPASSSSTKIYGCGDTTSINPAVNAPDTQTIIPAVSNGQITGSYTIGNVTVPVAAATATTVATGTVASTGSGASILTGLGTAVTAPALTSANLASGETGTSVVTSIMPTKGAVSGISGTAAENGEHTHGTVISD